MSASPIDEWVDENPKINDLLEDLVCHAENADQEEWKRMFAISLRDFLEEREGERDWNEE